MSESHRHRFLRWGDKPCLFNYGLTDLSYFEQPLFTSCCCLLWWQKFNCVDDCWDIFSQLTGSLAHLVMMMMLMIIVMMSSRWRTWIWSCVFSFSVISGGVQLLSHHVVTELMLTDVLMNNMMERISDPCCTVRMLSVRGLGNIAVGSPEKVQHAHTDVHYVLLYIHCCSCWVIHSL